MIRIITALLIVFLASSAWAKGLEPDPERNSGADATRLGAQGVDVGRMVIDNVDRVRGDATDWKFFRVGSAGVVTVTISFDEAAAEASLSVRDAAGVQVARHEGGADKGAMASLTFQGSPGVYYLEIQAAASQTDYSLEVRLEP